jgi:hypothetical protein
MSKRPLSPVDLSSTTCASRPARLPKLSHGQPIAYYAGTEVEEQSTSFQSTADSSASTPAPPASTERSVQRCFRISDIPLAWDDRRTLNLLADECSTEHAANHQLTLYPSVNGRFQVGILALTGPQDYVDGFAPDHDNSKRVVTSGDDQITIDRHFHGLTPLNTVSNQVLAE